MHNKNEIKPVFLYSLRKKFLHVHHTYFIKNESFEKAPFYEISGFNEKNAFCLQTTLNEEKTTQDGTFSTNDIECITSLSNNCTVQTIYKQ